VTVERVRTNLWDAAAQITQKLEQLLGLGLANCLPSSAVACTALPLALHILDVKLLPNLAPHGSAEEQSRRLSRQNRLNILTAAMRVYQPKYEGVDWVTRAIRYFMECTCLESTPACDAINNCYQESMDVIAQNSTHYLRLSLTLDLSLSQDRLPVERDFPSKLQALISKTGCFIPFLFSQPDEDDRVTLTVGVNTAHHPPSELAEVTARCASPKFQDFTGWVENDRSLFFMQEMGLGL
jgi:hypothetical protein